MSNPWTPGPWRAERAPFNPNQWAVQSQFLHVNGLTAWHVVATVFGADKAEEASTGGACHSEQADPTARLIAAAPEMAEALELLEDAASCIVATFERIPENYPESRAIHTHEGHTEDYLIAQIKSVRALLARIRGESP